MGERILSSVLCKKSAVSSLTVEPELVDTSQCVLKLLHVEPDLTGAGNRICFTTFNRQIRKKIDRQTNTLCHSSQIRGCAQAARNFWKWMVLACYCAMVSKIGSDNSVNFLHLQSQPRGILFKLSNLCMEM